MIPNVAEHAAGSVLVSFGKTRVICAATIEDDVPRWMKQQNVKGGWLSAEYSMLPYSTLDRKQRDVVKGKLDGRSSEIQRLIGRSLRAVVDLQKLGQRTLWLDCDVLQADGGTRTASITGACVAAAIAFQRLLAAGKIKSSPLKQYVAAVSCGICDGKALLDLNYPEDKAASVDFNVVMTEDGNFVEVQGSGEESVFSAAQMSEMLALATTGISTLVDIQKNAIAAADRPAQNDLQGLATLFGKR
jgi:ribonuclease PH